MGKILRLTGQLDVEAIVYKQVKELIQIRAPHPPTLYSLGEKEG